MAVRLDKGQVCANPSGEKPVWRMWYADGDLYNSKFQIELLRSFTETRNPISIQVVLRLPSEVLPFDPTMRRLFGFLAPTFFAALFSSFLIFCWILSSVYISDYTSCNISQERVNIVLYMTLCLFAATLSFCRSKYEHLLCSIMFSSIRLASIYPSREVFVVNDISHLICISISPCPQH